MTKNNLNTMLNSLLKAKQFLKSEISIRLKTQSYRDLEKITGLNSKQLQRINQDKYPHFESVLKAIQGLLNNPLNLSAEKRRE